MKYVGLLYEETEAFLLHDVFCAPVIITLRAALERAGVGLRFIETPEDLAGLEGVVYLAAKSMERARRLRIRPPTVLLLPDVAAPEPPAVVVDDEAVGRLAARALLEGGRRRLAALAGEEAGGVLSEPYRRRIDGFIAEAREGGAEAETLRAPFAHVPGAGGGAPASRSVGEALGSVLLARSPRPDGVFAVNDLIAEEILAWFSDAGVKVPEEVAVVGCDDLPTEGPHRIATVHVPKARIAEAAARAVLETLAGASPAVTALAPRFTPRASAPAAPSAAPAALRRKATPDGWLVAAHERCYGPYALDQLASFLAPDSWVYHESIEDWMRAAEVEALADVLGGRVDPALEWFVVGADRTERGPYGRAAIVRMARDGDLAPETPVRHASWARPVALAETPLAREAGVEGRWRPGTVRRAAARAARGRSGVRRTTAVLAAAATLAAIAGWSYVSERRSRIPESVRVCGPRAGSCIEDAASRCLCARDAGRCGCLGSTRGSCGMPSCVAYARSIGLTPTPPPGGRGAAPTPP